MGRGPLPPAGDEIQAGNTGMRARGSLFLRIDRRRMVTRRGKWEGGYGSLVEGQQAGK